MYIYITILLYASESNNKAFSCCLHAILTSPNTLTSQKNYLQFNQLALCLIRGWIGHPYSSTHQSQITGLLTSFFQTFYVFYIYMYCSKEAGLSFPCATVRIVICTKLGAWHLGARIPGLFFCCLLNFSVSCRGKADDVSSCVNSLWCIPHVLICTKPHPKPLSRV